MNVMTPASRFRYVDEATGTALTLRDAARAGLLCMVGAPVAAITEAMRARRSLSRSRSPSRDRDRTLSPQSTLRSNMSSRDVSFDTERCVYVRVSSDVCVCVRVGKQCMRDRPTRRCC